MANSSLNIIFKLVKQGGADQETISGLYQVKRSIMDTVAVTGSFVAAGIAIKQGLDATVGSLVAYASEVRNIQNATGASAEDASKLIQVLDDQKISYEQLEKAIQKSGKAYDFSINGIANMSEAYLKLGNEQDKAQFMGDRFGKQWIAFVPIMQQGKAAILGAADAVEESLILTQKAVDDARRYEIALDGLNDSVQGLKVSIGVDLVGNLTDATNGFNIFFRAVQIWRDNNSNADAQYMSMSQAIAQATQEVSVQQQALMQHKAAVDQDTESEKQNAEAVKATTAAHQGMLGLIGNIANEMKNYGDKQSELSSKMIENRAEAEKLYPWQKQQLDELNQKYADMENTYAANATAHNAAMNKIQFDLLVTKLSVGGITDAENTLIQQAGIMYGQFDQRSVDTAKNFDIVSQAVTDGKLKVEDMTTALNLMPSLKNIDIVIKTIQSMSGEVHLGNPTHGATVHALADGGVVSGPTSGHLELLHGTEAVIPLKNGSVPVNLFGGQMPSGGNTNITVQLIVSTLMNNLDQQSAQDALLPHIINGVREAQARGALK